MNKVSFTISLFVVIVMSSCSKMDTLQCPAPADENIEMFDSVSTRSEFGGEAAYVRIGMYENIDNHTVSISNLRIEGRNPEVELPQLGDNITSIECISSNSDTLTYDSEDGAYHSVSPSGTSTFVTIHFDALVKCENADYIIPVEDVKVNIGGAKTKWKSNGTYTYVICVDAALLGLSEITFDVSVVDYENVSVTD